MQPSGEQMQAKAADSRRLLRKAPEADGGRWTSHVVRRAACQSTAQPDASKPEDALLPVATATVVADDEDVAAAAAGAQQSCRALRLAGWIAGATLVGSVLAVALPSSSWLEGERLLRQAVGALHFNGKSSPGGRGDRSLVDSPTDMVHAGSVEPLAVLNSTRPENIMEKAAGLLEKEAEMVLWQMVALSATTYSLPNAESPPVGSLSMCEVIKGTPLGSDWVQLSDERGFAPADLQGVPVLAQVRFEKRREVGGGCEDVGLHSIQSDELCTIAGNAVGMGDWSLSQASDGCFAVSIEHPGALQALCANVEPCGTSTFTTMTKTTLTTTTSFTIQGTTTELRKQVSGYEHFPETCVNKHNIKLFKSKTVKECAELCDAEPACLGFEFGVQHGGGSKAYEPGDCQLSSSSDSTGCSGKDLNLDLFVKAAGEEGSGGVEHPSLFCFEVFVRQGYELALVKDQFERGVSIFACDGHMVLSSTGHSIAPQHDGGQPLAVVGIGSLSCEKGSWGSWANAGVFLKVWKAVIKDGRYKQHDWVVKVDADCVFRPVALKWHLSKEDGPKPSKGRFFFKNFMDEYPVVGAIEIASRDAIEALHTDGEKCEQMAQGAAEDDWFVKCMRSVGAKMRSDGALLQHERMPAGDKCSDPWWVAVHPFKDLDKWRTCERQALE